MRRYLVKVEERYESFVIIKAESPADAEERVQDLIDNGEIDGVNMRGTLKSGGYDRNVTCQGTSRYKETVQ